MNKGGENSGFPGGGSSRGGGKGKEGETARGKGSQRRKKKKGFVSAEKVGVRQILGERFKKKKERQEGGQWVTTPTYW